MASDKLPRRNAKSGFRPSALGVLVVFVIVAIAGSLVVYSLSDWKAPAQARLRQNPVPATQQAIGLGMSSYSDHCQNCHGEDGNGKGERAEKLSVAPSDFTDAHAMSQMTDGELFWKISQGHRPMPGFKNKLSDEERWQLVDYIRTFSQPMVDPPAETTPPAPSKDAAPK